jgi:hypothetical protein
MVACRGAAVSAERTESTRLQFDDRLSIRLTDLLSARDAVHSWLANLWVVAQALATTPV